MSEVKNVLQKALKDELKSEGLEIAEEAVKSTIKVVFKVLPKLIVLIKNPTIKIIAGIVVGSLVALEPKALEWADGIDGEVG